MGGYRFAGRDGVELAWHEIGSGRPMILLPGFGGTGYRMLEHGPAGTLAVHGHRVVLPDFRGYGHSAKPCGPTRYPPDILADDGLALVEHLGLGDGDYDLGGYSLGARIVVRMLARGAKPGRAIVAGQGMANVSGPQGGGENHRVLTALVNGIAIEPDTPDAHRAQVISQGSADPRVMLRVLDSLAPHIRGCPARDCRTGACRDRRSGRALRRRPAGGAPSERPVRPGVGRSCECVRRA